VFPAAAVGDSSAVAESGQTAANGRGFEEAETLALRDFVGRKLLLVFTQSGCGPCHDIVPELNRIHDKGEYRVLVVNNGEGDDTRQWAEETKARFPVLAQEKFAVAKRYEVFATPFAFLIDEQGTVTSKGIAGSREYLGYVLNGEGNRGKKTHEEPERDSAVEPAPANTPSESEKELTHA
jgi:peroxiredoxin